MSSDHVSPKFRALPAQLIETDEGVIIKRGYVEAKVLGDNVKEAVQVIFNATASRGATIDEICDLFDPFARQSVESLMEHLVVRKFLVSEDAAPISGIPENSTDVFYWHFGASVDKVRRDLAESSILVLGVNYISRQLVACLLESGFEKVSVLDHSQLRNTRFFHDEGMNRLNVEQWAPALICPEPWSEDLASRPFDCVVATSECDSRKLLSELNRLCVERRRYFLPVVLHDFIGSIGPLVVPEETACFECLASRVNSNADDFRSHGLLDPTSSNGQPIIGFHPSMPSILGNVTAFELTRFFSEVMTSSLVGSVIEVNLLAGSMKARKVLKVPRCQTCSSVKTRSPIGVRTSQGQEKSRGMT